MHGQQNVKKLLIFVLMSARTLLICSKKVHANLFSSICMMYFVYDMNGIVSVI